MDSTTPAGVYERFADRHRPRHRQGPTATLALVARHEESREGRREAVAVATKGLESYAGNYELRPGSALTFSVADGRVTMKGWMLIPTSETTFFSPQDYCVIAVVRGDDGSIERLEWTVAGRTYPTPRVVD